MLSQSELDTLEVIIRVTSTLSLVALIVVLSDLASKWSTIRFAPSRIVVWWMVSMIIPLPFMFLGRSEIPSLSQNPSPTCQVQASFISFGFLSSALWATLLAINVYLVVVRKVPVVTIRNAEWVYHLVAWGIPFLVAGAPIAFPPHDGRTGPMYGDARLWCWITSGWSNYRLWFFYIPIWIVFLTTLVVYAVVYIQVSQSFSTPSLSGAPALARSRQSMQARNRLSTKTALYLAAFFFSYSGATINRVATIFIKTDNFGLYVLHALTIPSIGIFAAVAYFGHRLFHCCAVGPRRRQHSHNSEVEEGLFESVDLQWDWDTQSLTGQTELALAGSQLGSNNIAYFHREQASQVPKRVPGAFGPFLNPQPVIPAPAPCWSRQGRNGQDIPFPRTRPDVSLSTRQTSLGPHFPLNMELGTRLGSQ